jgi:GAF domain-containing protein
MTATPSFLRPADDAQRLRSLRAYDILPCLIEPVFDEFVALTAQIFGLPISLIAVVEEDDVFYPANHGMPGNHQQPRVEALCSTAIQQARAVVYHDLALETGNTIPPQAALAAHNNELRFYAGALLRLPDQRPLGTLCVIDRQPRVFTLPEQLVLEQLAALVSHTVAIRHIFLTSLKSDATKWAHLHIQLKEELQELTALVRYLFTRYGSQVPISSELLAQVQRRLVDLETLLNEYTDL